MTLVGYGVSALNGQVFRYLYSICYVISQLIYFLFFFFSALVILGRIWLDVGGDKLSGRGPLVYSV